LTESVRFLGVYSSCTQDLAQRAAKVEQLLAQHTAAQEAARHQAEAEPLAAEEGARQQTEVELRRVEAERQRVSYINTTQTAASAPTLRPLGAASLAIAETASAALLEALSAAVRRFAAAAAIPISPLAVGVETPQACLQHHRVPSFIPAAA